ncbi:T9SS type A sorting domain-containing protein [Polluticoccus soli]|uniref:T9SS type A sorting domain-containing protein n=1 Tax=Polluticoccus soli TaxID=3034150 RepID=UPI0023E31945|nr:T9SS type A sorting domain-containing protein [Flavipsychrobacter sp. JY13-12]
MKKRVLFCLACCWLLSLHAGAQSIGPSIIASAGGGGVIGVQSFDFAVGEMTLVNTAIAPNVVLTQGVLQPHPPLTGITSLTASGKTIKVYPNPATDNVIIYPEFETRSLLLISVYDVVGRKLIERSFEHGAGSVKHDVNVASLLPGTYKLVVDVVAKNETTSYGFNIQILK